MSLVPHPTGVLSPKLDGIAGSSHNPDLVERVRADAALNAVDMATFYTPGSKGYTDYPALAA